MRKHRLVRIAVLLALIVGMVPMSVAHGQVASNIDVGITKTDYSDYYAPNTTSEYTIVVTNYGDPVIGAHVTDYLPAGVDSMYWVATFNQGMGMIGGIGSIDQYINLASGGSAIYTVYCSVNSSKADDLVNTAAVDVAGDVDTSNNVATDTDTKGIDVWISNSDSALVYTPGESVYYYVYVYNYSDAPQTGLSFNYMLPAGAFSSLTWTYSGFPSASGTGDISTTIDIPANSSVGFQVSGTVYPYYTDPITATASVTTPATDAHPENNTVSDTDYCLPVSDLAIYKSDGVPSCTPGLGTTYTITATNYGPSDAHGVTITDALSEMFSGAEWTAVFSGEGSSGNAEGTGGINETVTLPVGGTVTYTMVADIDPSAVGVVANTATIAPALGAVDPDLADNTAVDVNTAFPVVDLTVSKTDGVSKYVPGWFTTYTITVTNEGPSTLTGGTLLDSMPDAIEGATWTAVYTGEGSTGDASGSDDISASFDLAVGGSATFTVVAPIAPDATGDLENTAEVAVPFGTTNFGQSSATDTDMQGTAADLPSLTVYRFYNKTTGTHFYTSSEAEKDAVLAKWPTVFTLDGPAYHAPAGLGTVALYRFYNTKTGTHFYTASEAEKSDVLAKWPSIFTLEGVAYSVSLTPRPGMVSVYRFYNATTGAHFYTAGEAEKANVLAKYPQFSLEGVAFYVLP
jgi:uncharacterized repeat protein (TIGR01451 family)